MFFLFALVSVALVYEGLNLFSNYILGTRLSSACSEAMDTGILMERLMEEDRDLTYAVNYVSQFGDEHTNVYVTDAHGEMVTHTGDTLPDLSLRYDADIGDGYELYPNQGTAEKLKFENINLIDMIRQTFGEETKDQSVDRGEWMRETVIEDSFWVNVHWNISDYRLYVEQTIELNRQDVYYIARVGLIALCVLFIPLLVLFINTTTSVYLQRATTRLLYMDAVTGGHNWIYFRGNAQKQLEKLHSARHAYALIDLHIVHFSNYINCYGSDEAENLLECMDGFLRARMRLSEVFGHNAGADFGLLLRCRGENEEEWRVYCQERLRMLLAELASLQPERRLHIHAGVYLIPPVENKDRLLRKRKNVNVNQLFSYAGAAQRAEKDGCEQIFFFDDTLLEEQNWEQWVENHMQAALTAGEFEVYYQPKYEPSTKRLVAAEALVRWNCPEKGMISPGRFIPIFESNGFIMKLDDYMIGKVAKQQVEWALQGKKAIPVSVNVSRAHFALDDLAEHITRIVDSYGAKHELVELEVTESAFFDDKGQLIETINRLRAYGFMISIDDFGAGYSSLNSLKDIPLDILKLDAEFFRGEDAMDRAELIVAQTIQLAHRLGLHVVAEGVEHKEQVDFLANVRCDMIQGFYFARPLPLLEFEEHIERDA